MTTVYYMHRGGVHIYGGFPRAMAAEIILSLPVLAWGWGS